MEFEDDHDGRNHRRRHPRTSSLVSGRRVEARSGNGGFLDSSSSCSSSCSCSAHPRECRYCREPESELQPFVKLGCGCRGRLRFVHKVCFLSLLF